jgi:hypothetical protein
LYTTITVRSNEFLEIEMLPVVEAGGSQNARKCVFSPSPGFSILFFLKYVFCARLQDEDDESARVRKSYDDFHAQWPDCAGHSLYECSACREGKQPVLGGPR